MKPTPTYYARQLKKLLEKFGLRVEEEKWDGHKHIDLSIDSAKLDIEVDGKQHLTDPDQIITDLKRSQGSREDGYETIHVHNSDLMNQNMEDVAQGIAEAAKIRQEDFDTLGNIKKEYE